MSSSTEATFLSPQATAGKGPGSEGKATGAGLLAEASQQQRPVYTTAGTVWNPESAKPIRAPVRRGRASMSLGAPGGGQWSFLSQRDGESLFHPGQEPPAVSHYAPLQQNNDRAISPSLFLPVHDGNPKSVDMGSIEAGAEVSPIQAGEASITPGSSQSDMASVKLEGAEDDDVPDDDAFVRKLPMKTLVNLASYKNPFQQKAQHLLRVKSIPGPPSEGAPTTPNGFSEASAPSASQHLQSLATAPRLVPTQPTQMNTRPLVDSSAMSSKIPVNTQPAHSRKPSLFPSSTSTLATGPGAPEPLKAGPPGQRPQGPSKIESTLAASLNGAGVSNTVQSAQGAYPTQAHRQYPIQNMPKEADGPAMAGPPRSILVKHYGHDGARSSKEHADAGPEAGSAIRSFNFGAHPDFLAATHPSTGEGSVSEVSSRVTTPPGFSRQDHSRSQGNSSQSTRSGSGGVNVRQLGGDNGMPDRRVETTRPLPDRTFGHGDKARLLQQSTRLDPSSSNTAGTMDTRGAQFIGTNPSQVLGNSGQNFVKYWGNENLGSNIRGVDSIDPLYGKSAAMPVPLDGTQKQFSATSHVPSVLQAASVSRAPECWSHVENLEPYGPDPIGYRLPYFGQYPYGAVKVDDQTLREREAWINAWFYSNTSRLGKTMDEVLEERRHPRARPSPFGAIGDGRPAPKPGPKTTYPQISIERANEMPASEHARPLLNLAFQAILDSKDAEETRKSFTKDERKVKDDGESEESYERLGSAALLPSSFSDSD